MTDREHFDLELQDLLDGRLSEAEAARVEAHVRHCAPCADALEDLRRGRDLARTAGAPIEPPLDLRELVMAALDVADGETPERSAPELEQVMPPPRRLVDTSRRRLLVYAGGAVAAGIAAVFYLRRRSDLPADAVASYVAYRSGSKAMSRSTDTPAALEQFFNAGLPFRTRVFDLAMMQYTLVGGRVDAIGGHASAMYAYTGPNGRHLLCQMYVGTAAELPVPDERRTENGIDFQIYTRGAHTVVFWPEGAVMCVVVSDMPAADTLALAFAKAMKAL